MISNMSQENPQHKEQQPVQLITAFNAAINKNMILFENKIHGDNPKTQSRLACLAYLSLPANPEEKNNLLQSFKESTHLFNGQALAALQAFIDSNFSHSENVHGVLLRFGASWENCISHDEKLLTQDTINTFNKLEASIPLDTGIPNPNTRMYKLLHDAQKNGIINSGEYRLLFQTLHDIFNQKPSVIVTTRYAIGIGVAHVIAGRQVFFTTKKHSSDTNSLLQ